MDTAVTTASVCLVQDRQMIALKESTDQKDSAAWLHTAIRDLLQENQVSFNALDAIAIGEGPGSYTGLRVGMATAKGLCYATGLPLITISTLKMMAAAALDATGSLLCPMIDARRMEVFTACYDRQLEAVVPVQPMVLDALSFSEILDLQQVTFFGNGSTKFRQLTRHSNAVFVTVAVHAGHMAALAEGKLLGKEFASLPYAEPFYGKGFFNPRF